jgi:tetratricopeptide (TPR) repeat protein
MLVPENPVVEFVFGAQTVLLKIRCIRVRAHRLLLLCIFALAVTCTASHTALFAQDYQTDLELAKTALEMGRLDEALAILSRLISAEPQAQAYFYRGMALRAKGQQSQALDDFNKAISLDPKQPPYHMRRGIIFLRISRYQEAVTDFTRALELDPQQIQALWYRARALFALERHEEALRDLGRALQLNSSAGALYTLRGDLLSFAGDYLNAIKDYDRAIQLRPNDARAYNNRGVALANLGRVREAVEDLNAAMDVAAALPPQDPLNELSGKYW